MRRASGKWQSRRVDRAGQLVFSFPPNSIDGKELVATAVLTLMIKDLERMQ
jgi:hypothetical protein